MTINIKDFYLTTPMARSDYMRLKLSNLPDFVVQQYILEAKENRDGYVPLEIQRGVYGLMKSGLISQQLL